MVFKSTLLLSLALVQLAVASTITIVSPKAKDVWHAGQVVEFKWTGETTVKNETSKVATKKHHQNSLLSIALATGPSQSLTIDRVIASHVNITKGSYKWRIPKNINTTKKYVIEIGPNASDIAFAGYVTIVKAPTNSTAKPTKTNSSHKPTKTITPKPTNKHEPSSVCVVVPNKNGEGSTVKCHPKPHKSQPKKKQTSQHKKKKQSSSHSSKKKPATATRHPTVATPSI